MTTDFYDDFKASLTCVGEFDESNGSWQRAMEALAVEARPNTFTAVKKVHDFVVNQAPLLRYRDGLQFYDFPVERDVDVMENMIVSGATRASLLIGYEERPMTHLPGTFDYWFKDGFTLLLAALQFTEVKVRFYFDPAGIYQNQHVSFSYTGLLLNTEARKTLATRSWKTRTHLYQNGTATPLETVIPALAASVTPVAPVAPVVEGGAAAGPVPAVDSIAQLAPILAALSAKLDRLDMKLSHMATKLYRREVQRRG
jgi:hypothetical protein